MTLLVEKGTFTKTTSTATPVDQTVNLVDSGLTPKAIILWSNGLTTTDGTYAENYEFSYGFSDGTNDVCQKATVEDNDTQCIASYSFNNNCIISMCDTATPAAATQTSRGDLLSFGAGNFHINWTVQTDTTAKVIHYIVIGGTDIENVSVFQTTVGDTSTGNHSFNGSGTTFTPDMALIMTGSDAYVTMNSLSTTAAGDSAINLGAAKSTTEEWCISATTEDAATTSDTNMDFHNNACLMACAATTGIENFLADFVSFNSAAGGGITVNVTNAAGLSTQAVAFMLIKGGKWDVGTFQQRSGTGTQDVALDAGTRPSLVGLAGINHATANSTQAHNYLCLGGSDGTREGCSWCGDLDASGLMVNTRRNLTTKVYTQATPNATAASSTTNAEADMNAMTAPNLFQLNWTTASATLHQIGFWAVGVNARVASSRILKWDIIGRIQSSRILKWNINERIASSRILKWNIEASLERITSSRILKWDITGRIQSSRILKWDIIGRIQSNRIIKWNIQERIASSRILKWNIQERIVSSRILKWNIQERIQSSRILKWDIIGRIQSNRILKWNIQERIASSRILKWNINERIQSNRILKWNIQERIQSSRILKWNITGRIQSSRILKWNIESTLERITSSRILKWNITGRTQTSRVLKWNIQERITSSRILKWNIQERIQSSRILKWNINERIQSSRILKWNIQERIQSSRILKWNIEQSLERITTSRILKWNIQGRVQSSRILKWNILGLVLGPKVPGHPPSFIIKAGRKIPGIGSFLRGLYDRTGDDEIKRE